MNERGSATLFMLVLLPLILSGALVAFAGAMTIQITEKTNLICRQGLISAEAHIISRMNNLIKLNPTAQLLRHADKAAKLAMGVPIYGVINEISVEEARTIFHGVQLGMIAAANLEMRSALLLTKFQLNSALPNNLIQTEIVFSPTLAVEAKPRSNLTPDYQPKKDFGDLMLSQVKWTIRVDQFLPNWLLRFLNSHQIEIKNLDLHLSCSSTAQKTVFETSSVEDVKTKGSQWQAGLVEKDQMQLLIIKAKQLSNSF